MNIPTALRGRLVFAAASGAYNGLLANPLFTAVLGADVAAKSATVWSALPANLLGGAIGFAIFHSVVTVIAVLPVVEARLEAARR